MTCRRSQVRVLYRPLEIKNPELRFRVFYFKRHRRGGPFEACTAAQLRRCLRQKQPKQSRGRALVFASARRGAQQKSASATRPTCSENPELRFRVLLLQQRRAERISVRRTAKGPRLFSPGPFALVPVVGVEPTRVISTRDFESPSSAIPTHRLIVYVIITYLAGKIKRKVSLGPNSPAQRAAAAQTGAAGGDSAFWGAARAGALAAALMGSFLAGAGHLFSKKTLQMTRNFILYK